MIHQLHNEQTNALFRLVYDELILDRNFYSRDYKEKLLTIAWNRGGDQVITIDNVAYNFPANTIHCLMVNESFHFERATDMIAWQFSRDFYCIVDHDKEVSCVGFIFYGPPKKMFIHLNDADQIKIDMLLRMFQDEFFAPILAVAKVKSLDEAIQLANDAEYGLTAGIFTEDESEQKKFFDEIQAGVTYSNRRGGATTGAWPGVQSFGGWKASGSSGKSALGPHYVAQFMREQSQTVIKRQ